MPLATLGMGAGTPFVSIPVVQSFSVGNCGSGFNTISVHAPPSGTTNGDLLIAQWCTGNNLANPASGFTLLGSDVGSRAWYWKIANNEPVNYSWNTTTNQQQTAIVVRITGASTSAPTFTKTGQQANGSTYSVPSITMPKPGILFGMLSDVLTPNTPPSGMSELYDALYTAVYATGVYQQVASGATGARTGNMNANNSPFAGAFGIVSP